MTNPLNLTRDGYILFATRGLRMFGYGLIGYALMLFLGATGLSAWMSTLLITLTLLGDTAISLWLTGHADRIGRRRVLLVGCALMLLATVVFCLTDNFWLLLIAATIGVVSPAGKEVGPFLAVEQAALTHLVGDSRRTSVFAQYNLVGMCLGALGAFTGGLIAGVLKHADVSELWSYRAVLLLYGFVGLVMAGLTLAMSSGVELDGGAEIKKGFGLHKSRSVVIRLSALFTIDAFAGGFVMTSMITYWFVKHHGMSDTVVGTIILGAEMLGGISALAAGSLAKRFGLVNTMVFTDLPSNIFLILIPVMPTGWLAALMLWLRSSISQMDVPTRQSYTMAVVAPDERSAAGGVTNVARTIGASGGAGAAGPLLSNPALMGVPFFIGGALKIVYDLTLWSQFRRMPAPEEVGKG